MLEKPITRGTKLPYVYKQGQNVKVNHDERYGSNNLFERTSEYHFSSWFRDNVQNKRIKYRQYNRAAFIDIRELVNVFANGTAHDVQYHMGYFANTVLEIANDIAYDYATKHDLNQDQFMKLCSILQEHYEPFISSRNSVGMSNVSSHSGDWFTRILKDRFGLTQLNNPPSVHGHMQDEAEEHWTYDPNTLTQTHRNSMTAAVRHTMNPDQWSKITLGVIGIGLPTIHFVRYLWEQHVEDPSYTSTRYSTSDMLFAAQPNVSSYQSMYERYYWYANGRTGMQYDESASRWVFKSDTFNRRKWMRCDLCRELHNVKFLDWYKIRSYSNTRSRICFHCISSKASSYNVYHKAWILWANVENIQQARYDYPIEYTHIDDTDIKATGSKEFAFVQKQDENSGGPGDVEHVLPVETRRYLSYLRNVDSDTLNLFRWQNDLRRRMSINAWDRDQYSDSENAEVIRTFPADVKTTNNIPVLRVWMDNEGNSRDFQYRWSTPTETRVDDGWVDVNAGIKLNLDKNNYSYRPPFYYVDYADGKWLSTQTEANNRAVMDCRHCEANGDEIPGSKVNCPEWHHKYGLFMGLELEVIIRDERSMFSELGYKQIFERTIQTFHPQGYNDNCADLSPQLLYAKRDGSLPSHTGVEYISQPMSMNAWNAVPSLFWHTVEQSYKAFGVGGVGIHIHIPWDAFTEVQAYAFLTMLTALQNNNNGLLRKVAQRPSNQWTYWDELEYSNVPNTIAAVATSRRAENSAKYQGINLMHDSTIELRYFNSNAKGGRVMKNLEFVTMLYDYACKVTHPYDWDPNIDETPPEELVEIVEGYRRHHDTTTELFDMIVDDADEDCQTLRIEGLLMHYLSGNKERYPNLYGYLTNTDNGSIKLVAEELEDVYPTVTPEMEEPVEETVPLMRSDY
mgnify:CR=1 FL=1